jgi:glycosyltransferase involved in cell wall biosynthesis
MPEAMSFKARWTMNMFFERSLSNADSVVTNSQGTAERLRAMLGYSAAAVIRPGVSPVFRRQSEATIATVLARHSLPRPYILGVATLEPRKGLDSLIRAFCGLQSSGNLPEHRLVLVGDRGWRDSSLAELLRRSGPRIIWLGFLSDEELVALYSGCDLFVYPSKYEGFGMPVLEALACGARVVTSDSPELREAGGCEAVYVIPDEAGISTGILDVINSKGKGINGTFDRATRGWHNSSRALARVLTGEFSSRAETEYAERC